jgi:transcriptional regulator with XRE-family HTH domain
MAKKPHENSRLAKFLDTRLLELKHKKTQAEIAEEAGFINPNMLTMIKQGASKLPLDRVPALAKALDTDPALLLRLALEQAEGSTAAGAIYEIIGEPITANEMTWIREIREASGDTDPRLTSRAKTAIRTVLTK